MREFLGARKVVNCAKVSNPIGEILFVQQRGERVLKRIRPINDHDCCYKPISTSGNADADCTPIDARATEVQIPNSSDYTFIKITCTREGDSTYADGVAFVDGADDEDESETTKEDEHKLNVIVLGLDNTSRMHFLRSLPKSNSYLVNNLSAIVMKGYTKVADNSLPNILPVLTGQSYAEFTKGCAPDSKAHLDKCPFVWKDFQERGYKTGFSEDEIGLAIFNLNWEKPFTARPTDFYISLFSSHMEKHLGHGHDKMCYGTRLSFKVLLDNIENIAVALKQRRKPFFHFTWTTKLSHNDFNKLRQGDQPLLDFLQFMAASGNLNRSALILLGDHGNRAPESVQLNSAGKIEVRMPVLYIVLPDWFKNKYSQAYKNLQDNANMLTSPFDVYQTIKVCMNLTKLKTPDEDDDAKSESAITTRKPTSLFRKIPSDRSCLEAGVSLHWCVCRGARDQRPAPTTTPDAIAATAAAIDFINNELKPVAEKCRPLELNGLRSAYHIDYAVEHGDKYPGISQALRVYFKTAPADAYFSATLVQRGGNESWTMTDQAIRLDHYGTQSWCVSQEHKTYCACRRSYGGK
ncbi:uncharacterized protein LOC110862089 [Folsomia candida]|uniref:uncharacterized protein LOC110862089 n=1 Tax=Folsomia candida TaxID=158441 RepID=UPI001604F529|nr:uncharacterized protein LOC110862089 [Folsomia candida]